MTFKHRGCTVHAMTSPSTVCNLAGFWKGKSAATFRSGEKRLGILTFLLRLRGEHCGGRPQDVEWRLIRCACAGTA